MSKNFPLRRLPGKVVQQQTPSPKSRNFGQSYQRSDGYSYTLKQIPTRLTVYRRDASTLHPLTDRRKPAVQHLHTLRYATWIIGHGAHAQSSRAKRHSHYDVNIARELCACAPCPKILYPTQGLPVSTTSVFLFSYNRVRPFIVSDHRSFSTPTFSGGRGV